MSEDASDKTQVGLTDEAREQLAEIAEEGGFGDRQDAYRLAVVVALAEKLEPTDAGASRVNYLGVGSLDPDSHLRTAVLAVRDDHEGKPAAFIERLAEAGIARIHQHLHAGKPIRDLLAKYQAPSESEDAG